MILRSALLMLSLPVAAVCVGAMSAVVLAGRAISALSSDSGPRTEGGPFQSDFSEAA